MNPSNLLVRSPSGEYRLSVQEGRSVREALDATTVRVRAACGGVGSCGACVVRLLGGEANPATLAEYQKLTAEQRGQGLRLSCQLRPRGDVEILVDRPARPSPWKSIPLESLVPLRGGLPALERHVFGVAVDLGTTHIRVALWDRQRGRRIATRQGPNPQGDYGADVLNRLHAAASRPEHAGELARAARSAILRALRDMLARDVGEVSPMLAEIGQLIVVGNTAMLALLTARGGASLLDPVNWQSAIDCRPLDPPAWRLPWRLPNAEIIVADPVAGFVGSDLSAGLLATRLAEGPPGSLLLDVGTNIEIALWDGENLYASSVPGGPAFECVGIRHGMAAEPGAVFRVVRQAGTFACETIGGGPARGFCGSGLVDAIAVLLEAGLLKPSGRFATPPGGAGHALEPGNPRTAITGGDVDALQRAKAAAAAAMAELLALAGLDWRGVKRLCICGAFGHTLDIGHAQQIGLLPAMDAAGVELHANAALAGCEQALLTADGPRLLSELAGRTRLINLSYRPGYEDRYIQCLRLCPIAINH